MGQKKVEKILRHDKYGLWIYTNLYILSVTYFAMSFPKQKYV